MGCGSSKEVEVSTIKSPSKSKSNKSSQNAVFTKTNHPSHSTAKITPSPQPNNTDIQACDIEEDEDDDVDDVLLNQPAHEVYQQQERRRDSNKEEECLPGMTN